MKEVKPTHICAAATKQCSCGYRYGAADSKCYSSICPQCAKPRPCQHAPRSNGRCHIHGGKSLGGAASPKFKDGSRSKYFRHIGNKALADLYEESSTDATLLENWEDIRLLEARMKQLLGSDIGFECWEQLKIAWARFETASKSADEDGIKQWLGEINRLIKTGHDQSRAWKEIYRVQSQTQRARESERQRAAELQGNMPVERAMMLVSAMEYAVKRNVTEPGILAAIVDDFRAITHRPAIRKFIGDGSDSVS